MKILKNLKFEYFLRILGILENLNPTKKGTALNENLKKKPLMFDREKTY